MKEIHPAIMEESVRTAEQMDLLDPFLYSQILPIGVGNSNKVTKSLDGGAGSGISRMFSYQVSTKFSNEINLL